MHDDDTTNLSNILAYSDVDQSIISLTNQMKQNFILAKADIDKYFKQKSIQENITRVGESIIAKESDINELLIESDTEENGSKLRSIIDNVEDEGLKNMLRTNPTTNQINLKMISSKRMNYL